MMKATLWKLLTTVMQLAGRRQAARAVAYPSLPAVRPLQDIFQLRALRRALRVRFSPPPVAEGHILLLRLASPHRLLPLMALSSMASHARLAKRKMASR